ncbi:MAG: transcription elongation factor Spt5 [Nitrososphaera sp.]
MSDKVDDFEEENLEIRDLDSDQAAESEAESEPSGSVASKKGAKLTADRSVQAELAVTSSSPPAGATAQITQDKPASDSRFFAIRTTGGQERIVVNMLQSKMGSKKIGIRSILVLDSFKGYIIVEAADANLAYEALSGIRHVRGQIRGDLPFKDIEGYLIKKPVVAELSIDDTVEIIAGPFKAMRAKITRVDYDKQEATVVLLDSPYQIPVTVDANYLKKVPH